jgi:hypothetical protein
MDTQDYIPVEVYCRHYHVEVSFVTSLNEFRLIELVRLEETDYIPIGELLELEKLTRLHNDLELNSEAIDVTMHLLKKIKAMRTEIESLKSKLRLYEDDI